MNPQSTSYLAHLRELIANDDLPTALRQLRSLLEKSPKLDEALQQSGRLNALQHQIRLGTVSYENATRERDQIRDAIIGLLTEIETQQAASPVLAEELGKGVTIVNNQGNVFLGGTFNNPIFK